MKDFDLTYGYITIIPDYGDVGLSYSMKDKLRREAERQLSEDIRLYSVVNEILKYDWSESCFEGKSAFVLGSYIDRYSGVKIFNLNDEIIAEGWIDYIYEQRYNIFIVYWDRLELYENGGLREIKEFGVPEHVLKKLPDELKIKYEKKG